MTSRKSVSRSATTKTTVLVKSRPGTPSPAEQALAPSADANGIHERITARAYALHAERGYRQGCDLQDWLDAEREILSRQLSA